MRVGNQRHTPAALLLGKFRRYQNTKGQLLKRKAILFEQNVHIKPPNSLIYIYIYSIYMYIYSIYMYIYCIYVCILHIYSIYVYTVYIQYIYVTVNGNNQRNVNSTKV